MASAAATRVGKSLARPKVPAYSTTRSPSASPNAAPQRRHGGGRGAGRQVQVGAIQHRRHLVRRQCPGPSRSASCRAKAAECAGHSRTTAAPAGTAAAAPVPWAPPPSPPENSATNPAPQTPTAPAAPCAHRAAAQAAVSGVEIPQITSGRSMRNALRAPPKPRIVRMPTPAAPVPLCCHRALRPAAIPPPPAPTETRASIGALPRRAWSAASRGAFSPGAPTTNSAGLWPGSRGWYGTD